MASFDFFTQCSGESGVCQRSALGQAVNRLSASVLLIFSCALLAPGHGLAFERSHSLDRRAAPPTAYGLNLVRPEHRQIVDDGAYEVPANHSINVAHFAAQLERLEGEAGPYASQLTQPLMDLGLAYRSNGQAQEAIAFYKR
ncbi:MAG: hypothetical protein ACR2PS_05750, partial [Pseudomonadales bacterium]